MGRGVVPPSTVARRFGPRRARGRAPPRLCRPHAGQAPGENIFRDEPAHSWALADDDSFAFPGRTAGNSRRSRRGGNGFGLWRLCAIAFLQYGYLWVVLCYAWLAARKAAPG